MSDPKTQFAAARLDMQISSYYETLDAGTIADSTIKSEITAKFTGLKSSHINRFINNVQVMKYALSTSKTDIITTCFKVSYDGTSCIYAYLYSRCTVKGKKATIKHEFVCTGPTFRSQDGEYRTRFIRYDLFAQLFEKYGKIFNKVDEMIVGKLADGSYQFYADFYYPQSCKVDSAQMNEFVNNGRLAIKMYALAWLRDFHVIHAKIPENHMNPAYQYIIYRPEDLATYREITSDDKTKEKHNELIKRIEQFYMHADEGEVTVERLSCGQKIFPVTVIESLRTDDINYSVWREMYMTNLVSNLVLNLVTPSFPFLGSWFYIQNSHAGLFDNSAMFDKYKHSAIADDVSKQLRAIDRYNYFSKDRHSGALSGKFMHLSRKINGAIIYADSEIRLTDLSVCVTSEYVGRTLRDIPNIIAQKRHLHGMDLIFTDANFFAKHMFEYVYAFYCMNTRLGIIHGDLHMNNVTVFRLYMMADPDGAPLIRNPVLMYVLEPAESYISGGGVDSTNDTTADSTSDVNVPTAAPADDDSDTDSDTDLDFIGDVRIAGARPTQPPSAPAKTQPRTKTAPKSQKSPTANVPRRKTTSYVFPHNGLFSMVIDLSRAVLGDVKRLEKEFGVGYAEAYFHDQQNRLLHIINNNFPDIIESSQSTITDLVMNNFPLMFKILSCIDVFTVCSNIKSMFSVDDIFTQGKVKLAAGISKRLDHLISLSSQLFYTNIGAAIRGEITMPDEIDWPCAVILQTVFADFETKTVPRDAVLTDVFRSGNTMRHDISDYDSWGPLVSLEPYWDLWKKIIGTEHKEVNTLNQFVKDFSESAEIHQILLPYMKQEEEVLEFEPWMLY